MPAVVVDDDEQKVVVVIVVDDKEKVAVACWHVLVESVVEVVSLVLNKCRFFSLPLSLSLSMSLLLLH